MTLEDIANLLIIKDVPILFPDTCSLLDIIRIPLRISDTKKIRTIISALDKLLISTKNGEIAIVLSPYIHDEISRHHDRIQSETIHFISEIDNNVNLIKTVANCLNISISADTLISHNIEKLLGKIVNELQKESIAFERDISVSNKATERAVKKIPPGRKGAIADCLIYEHILTLMDILRNRGFNRKIVFITSNSNDYWDKSCKNPKPPIDTELQKLKCSFVLEWNWALSELI